MLRRFMGLRLMHGTVSLKGNRRLTPPLQANSSGMDPTPQSLTYATLPTLSHAPGNSLATPHECGRYVMLLLRQFAACGVDGGNFAGKRRRPQYPYPRC
ncbi:hypothetical protein [[Clostridium] scindens]|uniref:hypothetical protein n=3 Tax=Clostridium scindens (strain JCM 10418 / VPI 12708) TaxID=29347 RepID=UPI00305DC688|nr:hypothetical protein [Lachnospiraceae bacterium]